MTSTWRSPGTYPAGSIGTYFVQYVELRISDLVSFVATSHHSMQHSKTFSIYLSHRRPPCIVIFSVSRTDFVHLLPSFLLADDMQLKISRITDVADLKYLWVPQSTHIALSGSAHVYDDRAFLSFLPDSCSWLSRVQGSDRVRCIRRRQRS